MVSRRLVNRVIRLLESSGGCMSYHRLLAEARLAPSELREVIDVLELERRGFYDGEKVCLTVGGEALDEFLGDVVRALRAEGFVVKDVRGLVRGGDVIAVPGRLLRVKGVEVGFLVRVVMGHVPPQRLQAEASRAARAAERLAREWRSLLELAPPQVLVPLLVVKRGARRLVEGVPVVPFTLLRSVVSSPSQLLADPLLRFYRVGG